ncbi:hypothetical protein [Haloterrigena salifodinae]|uniref:hypothetical protein n=1 Tax=Haloterrigena salifodinae TaxID=2675099 RepID=UPI002012A10C|nr:hypothetical protein [Haloterrigena salifodinae]
MKPRFKAIEKGLEIIDPIERKRYPLETTTPVTPTVGNAGRIPFPVDSTIEIRTSRVTLPENPYIYVRNPDGTLCAEVGPGENISFSGEEYILDLSGPLKVYAHVSDPVQICVGKARAEIAFEKLARVTLSARSFHRRPGETVTTTDDPADIMRVLSTFGETLKTTTSGRSYPTLRGHPPAIELADEVSIPDTLNQPQTGIKIEIPPTLDHIFPITALAYYLGAEVVPGSTPRLITETGYSYSLDGRDGFETTVERVLRQIFFLDCIVQTEGETPSSLYERQAVEPLLEFDIGEGYEQSMVEQLETYLEVPFERIEPQVPPWYSEIRLEPTEDHIEFLPFIANDLASVNVRNTTSDSTEPPQERRRMTTEPTRITESQITNLGTTDPEIDAESLPSSPVLQQCWKNHDGSTIVSTKPLSASQNSITRAPREEPLRIEVICNDPSMNDELVTVHSTYQDSAVPFDVTVHHDLSKQELRKVFAKESGFLHYIGHIDSDGFRCSDGTLDAADLESVGTKTFFLNACRSYEQGLHLIEAGSIGGIVTLVEITNQTAVSTGNTIAQLLNSGIPLYAALKILQQTTDNDKQYHLLGEEGLAISQLEASPPLSVEIMRAGSNYEVTVIVYKNSRMKPGSVYTPYLSGVDSYYLVPGEMSFQHVSRADLIEFLNTEEFPVFLEGELRWSTQIKTGEL